MQVRIFLMMAVFATLQACTLEGNVDLYNDTDRSIILQANDTDVTIPSHSHARANVGLGMKVVVRSAQQSLIYDLDDLRPSLYSSTGWGPFTKRIMKAQLMSSGEIWFIPEAMNFPAKVRPDQPEGFPLLPVNGPNNSLQGRRP